MTNPTDTNQASEDGIRDLLRIIDIESGDEPDSYWIDESSIEKATAAIQELIRTEKLKLLAEVREAHKDGYMRGVNDFSNYFMDASNAAQRNPIMPDIAIELREAYRAPILSTKLEAEL